MLYFKPDPTMNPAEKARFKEKFDELIADFTGFQNAGKIPALPAGFSLEQLSAQQLDFLQHNKYTVSQIGALMGLLVVLLGSTVTTRRTASFL